MKTLIKELELGVTTEIRGTVETIDERLTKNGDPFLHISLRDRTGSVTSNIWNNKPLFSSIKDAGVIVSDILELTVKKGDENKIEIISFSKLERKEIQRECENLKVKLRTHIQEIKDPTLKKIAFNLFKKELVKDKFFIAPSTLNSGDSVESGMLSHVVRMMDLAKMQMNYYDSMIKFNQDIVIVGILFHEIGKLETLDKKTITNRGELTDYSYISLNYLNNCGTHELPSNVYDELVHIIGAVRGGFGLWEPKSKEAILVNQLDLLDSKMSLFEKMLTVPGENFGYSHGQKFYLG